MDGNPSMRGPSESATHIARADCPHLSDPEWEALQRLATVIGEAAVATMLRTLSPTEQHGVALGFIVKEQRDAATTTTTTASSGTTPRVQSLKLHVSNYVGKEGESLLRWLVEVHTAIATRRIFDDPPKVAFAMSCLGGRARSWAYGRRLTDATCFGTCAEFKEDRRQAFEPPKNEFRSRDEFVDLQQGKHDVHAYAQRAVLGFEHRDQPDGRGDQGRHVHERLEGWSRQDLPLPRVPKYSRSCDHPCHARGI
ncbi:hypothetical protein PI125_g12876 [Phytophthora idaei]|nr:hypothetical protein PI125_g12876 [Phytophthora idaei]